MKLPPHEKTTDIASSRRFVVNLSGSVTVVSNCTSRLPARICTWCTTPHVHKRFSFPFFFFYKHIPLIRDCVKRNCVTRSRDAFRVIYSLIKSAERFKRQPHRMSMVITRRTRYANDNEHLLHLEVSR